MSDLTKINSTHLSRLAYVYLDNPVRHKSSNNSRIDRAPIRMVGKAADLGGRRSRF